MTTPVKPLTLGNRLALTSYDIRFDDGTDQEVLGILAVFKQFIIEILDHAAYDLGVSFKMLGDDHPNLRGLMYWLARKFDAFSI